MGQTATCLSAPLIGIGFDVPFYKVLLAQTFNKFLPQIALPTGIDYTLLSRDKKMYDSYTKDPYEPMWFPQAPI